MILRCSCCKESIESECFYKVKANKNGFSGVCKPCMSIKRKKYRKSNIDKIRKKERKYKQNNKERLSKRRSKLRREKQPGCWEQPIEGFWED